MRSIWKGAIGFGLVNIPVKLYSATQNSDLDLDMLDKKDHSNINFKRVNANTGKEVAWENIIRGYKLHDQYVILTDADFKSANAKKSEIIEITDFVNERDIDTIYFEVPYYLEPEKSGEKAYQLLNEALKKTGKAGIASFVLRKKEHLCLLRPYKKLILLNQLRFAEEIRDETELKIPAAKKIAANEMKIAVSLINQLSSKFSIAKYKDRYRSQLLKLIQAKGKGVKIAPQKMKVVHKSGDLMTQLKASLEKKKKKAS